MRYFPEHGARRAARLLRLAWLATALVGSFALPESALAADAPSAARGTVPVGTVGPCTDVQIIGLRGSGDNPPDPKHHGMGSLVGPVADQIALQVQDAGTVSFYGLPYKAGDAKPQTVLSGSYFASKKAGSALLHDYLKKVVDACPSMKLVVIGYSQGAHAAGDQLAREPTSITNKIKAFVMFGDPRFNPDASYTWGSFDRRAYGLNGKRSLSDFRSWSSRVFSFCNSRDPICQGTDKYFRFGMGAHKQDLYVGNYSTLVAGLVRKRLGYPRPPSAHTPLDLAFVIDTTGSMGSAINGVKDAVRHIAQTLKSRGSDFRIGLVDFKDHPDQGDPYASRLDLQMTSDTTAFESALGGLAAGGGGDGPEAVYSGLMTAINDLRWRNVTRKSIILMGDAPAKDPEPVTGFTSKTVTDAARALDPATINPVVVGGAPPDYFQGLADDSGGTVFQADDPSEVAEQVVAAVDRAAVPLYTSLTVGTPARPGTPVQFSAAGSYYDAGEIVSYAWDFDGDGSVDQTTAANRTTHVYDAPFSGIASVTVNTNDGQKASVTSAVDVREDAPLPPGAPARLTATSSRPGSITASWQPPSNLGGGTLVNYHAEIERIASGEIVYSAGIKASTTRVAVGDLPPGAYRVRVSAASEGGLGRAAQRNIVVAATATDGQARCTITRGSGNDMVRGTPRADVICAGAGNDIVYGLGGNDVIRGGAGNDILRGGEGSDRLAGGSGNDNLVGGAGGDRLVGASGADILSGQSGPDSLEARDGVRGNDAVNGGPGSDSCSRDAEDVRTSC